MFFLEVYGVFFIISQVTMFIRNFVLIGGYMLESSDPPNFCTSCGQPLAGTRQFCSACGVKQTIPFSLQINTPVAPVKIPENISAHPKGIQPQWQILRPGCFSPMPPLTCNLRR